MVNSNEIQTSIEFRSTRLDNIVYASNLIGVNLRAPIHMLFLNFEAYPLAYFNEKFLYFDKQSDYIKEYTRITSNPTLIPEMDSFK
jgi:hypothetical protein